MGCARPGMDEDGMVHVPEGEGSCVCREELSAGVKSSCVNCGELYTERVGGGTGCTKCFNNTVADIELSRGSTESDAALLATHGVGRAAWNASRIKWNEPKPNGTMPHTKVPNTREFESEVSMWIAKGGDNESRPRFASIPLNTTIKCLQTLETWVPVGKLK
eukprot:Rhum_TRINITY_DN6121_c0_g1::Rhum_TRINITY_DN6121_c0_g1_i1::g.19196::m.19196